jgi:hypothetical protein
MQLPRAVSRSLFSPVVIAILFALTPHAKAAGEILNKPVSPKARTERLVFTPAILGFGKVAVGRQKSQFVTITNSGNREITLFEVTAEGRYFSASGLILPLTLAGGESFTFTAVFAPQSSGDRSGSLSFVSDAPDVPNPSMLELTGSAADAGRLTVDPAALNFGPVQVGTSAGQTATLSAPDNPVTIGSAISSSPEFTLSGLSFPFTIPAGGSAGFSVTFTPQASGGASATISFMDVSRTNPLIVEPLTGVGVISQGHSVNLSWNASTSENVIGYNVYRGTASGGPYSKINYALDQTLEYIDFSVVHGETYYYVTTAVDSNNQESAYSNQAQATLP